MENNKNNLEVLSVILIESSFDINGLKDCYYTNNIYIAAFLKTKGYELVVIQKCKDTKSERLFTHFWFDDKEGVKPDVISYWNDPRENVSASQFVVSLQAIKRILNLAKKDLS